MNIVFMISAMMLAQSNWSPDVRAELEALIQRNKGNDSAYAVFDFDNTIAIGDISNVCQWRQLEMLAFKSDIETALKSGIPMGYHDRVKRIADLIRELQAVEEEKRIEMPAWYQLAHEYWTLYGDLIAHCGTDVAYPWIGHLFAGYTSDEYQSFARLAARRQLSVGKGLRCGSDAPVQFPRGFAITPESRELIRALRKAGISVYVVSASNWELVQAMLYPEFGLQIDRDKVFAYRLAKDGKGRYLPQLDMNHLRPQAGGKVEIIRKHIAPRHGGSDPVLVAGDSMGDYNMFVEFPALQVALIYNRNPKKSPLADLIRNAKDSKSPRILVQGRDATEGKLIPSHDSPHEP